jgi:hypothetical protein
MDNDLYPDEDHRREFLRRYGEEYLAFDFGLQICTWYELEKIGATRMQPPILSEDFLIDLCHMLKFKHVSPHAMYLIYKSILL